MKPINTSKEVHDFMEKIQEKQKVLEVAKHLMHMFLKKQWDDTDNTVPTECFVRDCLDVAQLLVKELNDRYTY